MVINFIKPKITIYDHPSKMPLWNFLQYLETRDLHFFTKEHKEHKDLSDIMTNFFGFYIELSKNNSIINRFGIIHDIMRYRRKYQTVDLLVKTLYNFPEKGDIGQFKEFIEQLSLWNYKIDTTKDIFRQLETIHTRIQGLKTKITLLENELKEEDAKTVVTIESQMISVERGLELRYKLNSKEITVLEWIEYQKQLSELIERQKNGK
jgi:hypothetical protein